MSAHDEMVPIEDGSGRENWNQMSAHDEMVPIEDGSGKVNWN